MFGFIEWVVISLAAGIVARAIMPGKLGEPSGWRGTMVLGVLGAVLGNWGNRLLFASKANPATENFLSHLFLAVVGSCAVIGVMRLLLMSRNLLCARARCS